MNRQFSLFSRLMLVFALFVLPTSFIGLYNNAYEQNIIRQTALESRMSDVSFYLTALETEIFRLQSILYTYCSDEDFIKVSAFSDSMSSYQRTESILNIRKKLLLVKQISNYASNIYAYLPASGRSINAINSNYELTTQDAEFLLSAALFDRSIVSYNDRLLVKAYFPASSRASKLPSLMLMIEIDLAEIRKNLSEAAGQGGAVLMGEGWSVSSGGNLRAEEREQILRLIGDQPDGMRTGVWQEESSLFVWKYSKTLGSTMLVSLPQSVVLAKLWKAENLLKWMIVLSVLGLIAATFSLYHIVHVPMRRLVHAFEAVESGGRDVRLDGQRAGEFAYLYTGFNHMMDTLNELIQQVYEQRILSQQSQLKQLQTQINPHFFYNTFFTVQGMIDMGDTDSAVSMLNNLGRYFQFITRSGRDCIPLLQEASHARAYLDIQAMRFENIAASFQDVPPEIEDFIVPRLILQPLIENAYVHGLEDKLGDGFLRVRFSWDAEAVFILIEDDGREMSPEQLAALTQKLNGRDAPDAEITGMVNIHHRLRLFYGDGAGIAVESNQPMGLRVQIRIPMKGELAHVPTSDRGQRAHHRGQSAELL